MDKKEKQQAEDVRPKETQPRELSEEEEKMVSGGWYGDPRVEYITDGEFR